MTGQTIGLLLVMIIYLILMVGIGVLYSQKNNDCFLILSGWP